MGGLPGPWSQCFPDVGNLPGDTGAISSVTVLLVTTMVLVQQVCSPQCMNCTAVHEKMCLWRHGYCVKKTQ